MNAPQQPTRPTTLWLIWALSFGSLVLAFPAYSVAVFAFDLDRKAVADIFALQVTLAYWIAAGMLARLESLSTFASRMPAFFNRFIRYPFKLGADLGFCTRRHRQCARQHLGIPLVGLHGWRRYSLLPP